jgi:hypothetical protein
VAETAKSDNRPLEWLPIKGRPYGFYEEKSTLLRSSPEGQEFESGRGRRYWCVINERGYELWLSLRSNRPKFSSAFGTFVDRTKASWDVCIFRSP